MKILAQFILGVLAVSSLGVLAHYLAAALLRPAVLLNFLNRHKGKFSGYIYYGMLFSSWLAVAFVGAKGLLFWIPGSIGTETMDGTFFSIRETLAGFIALFSTPMIRLFEEIANNSVRLKYLDQEKSELTGMLRSLHSIEYRISNYEHLQKVSEHPHTRELYGRLLLAARELQHQMKRKIENARYKEKRQEQEQQKQEAERIIAEQNTQESLKRLEKLRLALTPAPAAPNIAVGTSDIEIDSPIYTVLDSALVRKKWAELDKSANTLLELNQRNIDSGERAPTVINSIVETWSGTKILPEANVIAMYSGSSQGGSTSLHTDILGHKYKYLNGFRFGSTFESLIEAFFVAYQLPTKGHYRDGLQGFDYTFLLEQSQLVNVLHAIGIDPADSRLKKLNRPCGIRVSRSNESFRVKCLGAYPNGSIHDFGVLLTSGRVRPEPAEQLVASLIPEFS